MADVVQKIVSGNNVKSDGTTVVSCLPTGRYNTVDSSITNNIDLTAVENKLTAKFVKTTYEYNT